MMADSDLAYGELRGFLDALARINDKADHGYTFAFDLLPAAEDASQAAKAWFNDRKTHVELTPIEDWQRTVREILGRWLFEFHAPSTYHLVDTRRVFSLSHDTWRDELLAHVISLLRRAVEPTAVWKVDVQMQGFYECAWDDVVFEALDRFYLLHLGVSD